MLVKDYKKFINLSRLINSSYGKSGRDNKGLHTQSVIFELLDDGMMKVRYMSIVNFGSDTMMREMMRRYKEEALTLISAKLKKIKEEWKVTFPNDPVPTFELVESSVIEDMETTTGSMYSGNRKSYFRLVGLIEVS